jgi:hypothetical protein
MVSLAVKTTNENEIKNIFRLKKIPDDIIQIIINYKKDKENNDIIEYHRNCIVRNCLNFNILDHIIESAIPIDKDEILWSINVEQKKGYYIIRNKCMMEIEMIGTHGFIKTSYAGKIYCATLQQKKKLFRKFKSFSFLIDCYCGFIAFNDPITIDSSGKLIYF